MTISALRSGLSVIRRRRIGVVGKQASQSLARRLLRSVFGLYFLVTIIVTCVQLGLEYRQAARRLNSEIAAMEPTFGPGISDAMWALNDDVLRGIVAGMQQLPAVVGIRIVDERGKEMIAVGTVHDEAGDIQKIGPRGQRLTSIAQGEFLDTLISQDFNVLYAARTGERRVIGRWTVFSDRKIVIRQVVDDFLIVLINSVIKTVALWLILLVVIERIIGRPLRQLSAFVAQLDINNLGAEPFTLRDRGRHELHVLTETFNLVTGKLRGSIEENKTLLHDVEEMNATLQERVAERTRELERVARTDALTGLFNRRRLDEVLEYEFSRVRRFGGTLSVVMGDIDHFKSINDKHGHQVGDLVLATFAGIIRCQMREVDTAGRWGGEEFMIVCPQTPLDGVVILADRLRRAIETTDFPTAGRRTCSFGVAELQSQESVAELVARVDAALYRAKSGGRNRVETDEPETATV